MKAMKPPAGAKVKRTPREHAVYLKTQHAPFAAQNYQKEAPEFFQHRNIKSEANTRK